MKKLVSTTSSPKNGNAMRLFVLLTLPVLVWCTPQLETTTTANITVSTGNNASLYRFYREMGSHAGGGTRRVFGGEAGKLTEFAAACILMDRYWTARCSAAVVAPRWVLTAAHCVSPRVAYVKYNAERPSTREGNIVRVLYLYRHPQYKVEEKDEGRGMDVVLLHHDVGLARVNEDMQLSAKLRADPLIAIRMYDPAEMNQKELQVLGFGRTEALRMGEELVSVKLLMVNCHRPQWYHCMCGIASPGRSGDAGVCAGDSGGPVLYRGVQVAVTSMGPLDCTTPSAQIPSTATSVFTALHNYADLINATIHETETSLRMKKIESHGVVCRLSGTAFGLVVLQLICKRL